MNIAANTLYIVVGWLALIILPELIRTLPWPALVLLVLGGLLYTAGAIVLNRRAPDPSPEVFGYHEVWHTMVVGGSLCHYLMILIALLALT
jgi:hemolysin III